VAILVGGVVFATVIWVWYAFNVGNTLTAFTPPPANNSAAAVAAAPASSCDPDDLACLVAKGENPAVPPAAAPAAAPAASVQASAAPVTTSEACPGELHQLDLDSDPVMINPNGTCVVKWRVDSGKVDLIDKDGNTKEVGPEGGDFPGFWTVGVKAAAGITSASIHYKLTTS
jgi:hypothetical protein